jgi:SynChlorMet cassette radical SAM/SPASM protein ScmE
MNSTDKPIASPAVGLREESDGWAVLFHRETAASVGINPVGVAIWKLLEGRCSVEQIAAELRDNFSGVPGSAPEEIGAFVDQLAELGFVGGELGGSRMETGPTEEPGVMDTPAAVQIMITARCNLNCRYCSFFGDSSVTYQDLPAGEWLKFFKELGRCGVDVVLLSGGETFIREDLPQLLDGIVENGMRFGIVSNGGLIDDRIAAHMAATGGCNHVMVSVDGSCPETHDAFRGRGAFDGAIRGIRILQRHGLRVLPKMVVHRKNVHDLEAAARLLLEELQLPEIAMSNAYAFGRCRINPEEVLLTVAEREAAMATLSTLSEKYDGHIYGGSAPLTEGRGWQLMEEARQQGRPAFPDGGRLTGCRCVNDKSVVFSDGTMVPCPVLRHMVLGRINRDSLTEVWRHSPLLDRLRRRRKIPLTDFAFCAGCDYIPYCTGNCPAPVYARTGTVDHPSPEGCLRRYLAEGGRLP